MIPGALLLDEVICAIAGERRDVPMTIHAVKFLQIVRPGETVDLSWEELPGGGVKFECRVADVLAAIGRLAAGGLAGGGLAAGGLAAGGLAGGGLELAP